MRVVWRGTISFGLVTIPVRLYVATENKNIPSHQIHVNDGGRVQYKRVCSIDGAEVPYEEIGRGYESATGEIVMLSEVDLDRGDLVPAGTGGGSHLPRSQLLRGTRTARRQGVPAASRRAAQAAQGRRRQGDTPRSRDCRSVASARRCA